MTVRQHINSLRSFSARAVKVGMLLAVIVLCAAAKKPASNVVVPSLNTYSFEELASLQKKDKRKVMVFVHTEWCKFCLKMEQLTLTNPEVVRLLNEKYYFVSFDAESKKDIHYQGHTFKYKPNGTNSGVHELAEALATINGSLNYPSVCILDNGTELKFQYGGFMNSVSMQQVLSNMP